MSKITVHCIITRRVYIDWRVIDGCQVVRNRIHDNASRLSLGIWFPSLENHVKSTGWLKDGIRNQRVLAWSAIDLVRASNDLPIRQGTSGRRHVRCLPFFERQDAFYLRVRRDGKRLGIEI